MATNPQRALEKWKARMAASATEAKEGVQGVQVAPTQLAAQAADKYIANVNRAFSEGRFQAGCGRVSLQDWQQAMITKGIPNMANGAQKISASSQKAMQDVIAFAQQVSSQIRAMPNVTEADADQRMLANVAAMRQYRAARR